MNNSDKNLIQQTVLQELYDNYNWPDIEKELTNPCTERWVNTPHFAQSQFIGREIRENTKPEILKFMGWKWE